MRPAPSLSGPEAVVATAPRRATAQRAATAAAAVALVVHFWGLYRDQGPPRFRWFAQVDKVEHLVGFGLPCFFVLLALHLHAAAAGRRLRGRTVGLVVALLVLHAGVSEVLQGTLYASRSGDPYDVLADLVGTALGLLGYLLVRRRGSGTGEGRVEGRGPGARG